MADRTIIVRLRAEVDEFRRRMGDASNAVEANRKHIDTLANGAGLMGAAMVGAAALAVKSFADFDESMSAVKAATHESTENMDLLRAAALKAGKDTKYSATEAASGIEELAKAGIKTTDILGGGLDGALSLAAAGAIGVGDAAEIAATAMTQFKLGGDKVNHVADLLAAGAGKAQGGVGDLGMALKQAGLVAESTGLSIEETTAGLAAFASAGLIGSDAGTSFKSMLQRLTPQSAEAQKAMDELGISAYDSQGNFIGLAKFAGNLQGALKDLTPEQRSAAMATIFGSDAVRAANILYNQGEKGIQDWTAAVDDSGYAAETAATRMDNLKGDVEQLGGSIETALIGLGAGADGPLRDLVQQATDVVNAFAGLPADVQGLTLGLIGGGGLVLLAGAGIAKLVTGINEAKIAMQALNISAKTAAITVAGVGAAIAAGTILLTAWADETARNKRIQAEFSDTLSETAGVTAKTRQSIRDLLAEGRNMSFFDFDSAYTEADKMGISFSTLTDYVLGNKDAITQVNSAGDEYIGKSSAWENIIQSRQSDFSNLTYSLDSMSESLTEAQRAELQKIKADEEAGGAQKELVPPVEDATSALDEQVDTLGRLLDAQKAQTEQLLGVRDAQRGYETSIDDATAALQEAKDAGVEMSGMLDISTEAGRKNQAALDAIATAGQGVIDSSRENGATQEELQAAMQRTRDDFINVASSMGMSADEANALADELGLIPSQVPVAIVTNTAEVTQLIEEFRLKYAGKSLGEISMDIKLNAPNLSAAQAAEATRLTAQAAAYYNGKNGHAAGGYITGPGTSTSDSIPALLSNGEYVIKANTVAQMPKSYWDNLNAGRFARGGYVGTTSSAPAADGRSPVVVNQYISTTDPLGGAIAAQRRLSALGV